MWFAVIDGIEVVRPSDFCSFLVSFQSFGESKLAAISWFTDARVATNVVKISRGTRPVQFTLRETCDRWA